VLLISTDPAHSLGDALARDLGPRPTVVRGGRGRLAAVELDADRALARWLGARRRHLRTIVERGTYLDADDVDRLLDLSLPGVNELVGLVEIQRLAGAAAYDDVVVDTAPTGHTLRLLAMPATLARMAVVLDDMEAKHRLLAETLGGGRRPDAAHRVVDELEALGRDLAALLRDPARCRFTWVLLPEVLPLEEAADGIAALERDGITVAEVVLNRVTPARRCAACAARRRVERAVMARAARWLAGRVIRVVPDFDREPRGVGALRRVGRRLIAAARVDTRLGPDAGIILGRGRAPAARRVDGALEAIAPAAAKRLIFAGKGGVGKTTCAAAVALGIARRRRGTRVLLLSTDPAHSLGDVLATPVGDEPRPIAGAPGLAARELDADRAWAVRRDRYRKAVDALFDALRGGSRFDPTFDRAVVQDLLDLAPPGLDEVLGMLAVIDAEREWDTVVVDTAPTGHALRLLEMPDAALAWLHALMAVLLKYREVIGLGDVGAELLDVTRDVRRLRESLRDAAATRLVVVSRAAELPYRETARLLARLERLRLPVGALVVNALSAGCRHGRGRDERRALAALRRAARSPARRACAIILTPTVVPPPRGPEALERWRATWTIDGDEA
jgi:arsenite-transporting ATPase